MTFFKKFLRTVEAEDGTSTIEFVIIVPVFLLIFVSMFELGMAMTRLTMLEHSLDVTMRDIRIETGREWSHDEIRDDICLNAGFLKECFGRLQVEMIRIDRDDWILPDPTATCRDTSDHAPDPVTNVTNGEASDIMFIRACFAVEPLFPTFGLGAVVEVDTNQNMHLVASSAFAQEPE